MYMDNFLIILFLAYITFTDLMLVLDIVKWPILVLIILLFVRKSIMSLIDRITKIGHGSASFEVEQQKSARKQEKEYVSNVDKVLGLFRTNTIEYFKKDVLQDINIASVDTDSEKVDILLNYSIAIHIIRYYEMIYNSIYGSQLLILQQLNSDSYETIETVKRYYKLSVEKYPIFYEKYSYENYLDFLFSFNLITIDKIQMNITIIGVDFLKYINETSKTMNKLY